MQKIYLFVASIVLLFSNPVFSQQWEPLNCPLYGRATHHLTENNGIIYAGTHDGVYITKDDGENWEELKGLPDNFPVNYGGIIAFANNIIVSSMSNSFKYSYLYNFTSKTWHEISLPFGIQSFTKVGETILAGKDSIVFKSNDLGKSWTPQNFKSGNGIVLGGNDTIIYAGIKFNNLYYSKDTGRTWQIESSLGLSSVLKTRVTAIFSDTSGNYLGVDSNVYKNDVKTNWVKLNSSSLETGEINAIEKQGKNIILLGQRFSKPNNVFLSIDDGKTFKQQVIYNIGIPIFETFTSLLVNEGKIFAGLLIRGVSRSTDSGLNWELKNQGLTSPFGVGQKYGKVLNIFAYPDNTGALFSKDKGMTWISRKEYFSYENAVQYKKVENKEKIYIGSSHGFSVSLDSGLTWQKRNNGIEGEIVKEILPFKDKLLISTNQKGLLLSSDEGIAWSEFNEGLPSTSIENFTMKNTATSIFSVITHSGFYPPREFINSSGALQSRAYYGTSGRRMEVYQKPLDFSSPWIKSHNGLPDSVYFIGLNQNVSDIFAYVEFSVQKSGYIKDGFGGITYKSYNGFDKGIFKFNPFENKWDKINLNFPDTVNMAFALVGKDLIIRKSINGQSPLVPEYYRSNDGGNTWNVINKVLPSSGYFNESFYEWNNFIFLFSQNKSILKSRVGELTWKESNFGIDHSDSIFKKILFLNSTVFIQSENNIYYSNDTCTSWRKFVAVPNNFKINNFFIFENDLYIWTSKNGGWKYNISNIVSTQEPRLLSNSFSLFPNPANNEVTVKLPENRTTSSKLKLLRITGENILEKIIESKLEQFSLDLSDINEGIYLLSIENEDGKSVQKIVVHK